MNLSPDCIPFSSSPQHSPVDISCYERMIHFSEQDLQAISIVTKKAPNTGYNRWRPGAYPNLEPLVFPLFDMICRIDGPVDGPGRHNIVCGSISILLREMYQRKTSFWVWTEQEWQDVLCPSGEVFQKRHRASMELRGTMLLVAYVFGGFVNFSSIGVYRPAQLAIKVFGPQAVQQSLDRIHHCLRQSGYSEKTCRLTHCCICEALLISKNPALESITREILTTVRRRSFEHARSTKYSYAVSVALTHLGILDRPLLIEERWKNVPVEELALRGIAPEWVSWCKKWRETSTRQPAPRTTVYYQLLTAGRWLAGVHPTITSPEQWTRELAAEYVAMIDQMKIGDWTSGIGTVARQKIGEPIKPMTKANYLSALRTFFRDAQEWSWIPRRFDPFRVFATPSSVTKLIGPKPRIIADDIWAKLLHAGLNLKDTDFAFQPREDRWQSYHYPLLYVQAVVVVWLFAGLRRDEIRRLRLGCVRWQMNEGTLSLSGGMQAKDAICLLDVPVNKTTSHFTKPVDKVVGEAIALWEKARPSQPAMLDRKTGEQAQFLFAYRGRLMGLSFINESLIPVLCRKAGVPEQDARGDITSHRARSTIASQLFNAKEPMTLFELQAWLGHSSPHATQYYANVTPKKLARAYADTDYFKRNIRAITIFDV